MESVFLYLAKLGDEDKIEYFYKKNKDAIENRDSFDKFSIYKNQEIIEGSSDCSTRINAVGSKVKTLKPI